MIIRFVIIFILTSMFASVLLFLPQFNVGSLLHQSVYEQYAMHGQWEEVIKRVGGLSLILFLSLLVMFGRSSK
jgi:hypothetical protein